MRDYKKIQFNAIQFLYPLLSTTWQHSYVPVRINWKHILQHIEAETNGRHFAEDIFKCIFLNENVWIRIKISLKFVPN